MRLLVNFNAKPTHSLLSSRILTKDKMRYSLVGLTNSGPLRLCVLLLKYTGSNWCLWVQYFLKVVKTVVRYIMSQFALARTSNNICSWWEAQSVLSKASMIFPSPWQLILYKPFLTFILWSVDMACSFWVRAWGRDSIFIIIYYSKFYNKKHKVYPFHVVQRGETVRSWPILENKGNTDSLSSAVREDLCSELERASHSVLCHEHFTS